MDAEQHSDSAASQIATAIGGPARARMLYCLVDGRARTSTELSVIAEVGTSTASVHLNRLAAARLVKVFNQGKHRFYSLAGPDVASALEALSVLAGDSRDHSQPRASNRLRAARTCYDHIAGMLGIALHDRLWSMGWITNSDAAANGYDLTPKGVRGFESFGIDIESTRKLRRRFACPCLDWTERRPHIGGALGAALSGLATKRKWVLQDLDSRALEVTKTGRREMLALFGLQILEGSC
jgi:DNA-binding transcriptional ArsR family regulator